MMPLLPPGTNLGTVHLTVTDLEGTSAFYRDALGFRGDVNALATGLSASGAPPHGLVLRRAEPGAVRHRTAGLYHVAILLSEREDLAKVLRHLIDTGAPIDGASDHAVSEAVYLRDPEGNGIELYADRPRERWPTRGGQLEMTTKALDLEDLFRHSSGSWEGLPVGTRIGHIHLRVNDLSRAEKFYAGVLGFEVTVRGYPGALFVAAGGYHHHIGLNTWAGPLPPAEPAGPGLRHFTIALPDRDAREAVAARAHAAGVAMESGEDGGLLLRDPDGIGVMLAN